MSSHFARSLFEVALAVLILNIPFGFWRHGTRNFTLPWFLAVHIPVPMVIGLRVVSSLGWRFTTFPVLVASFFFGQFLGGKIHQLWKGRKADLKSCDEKEVRGDERETAS